MILHLISIIPYTYYSFVDYLGTLVLIPLGVKAKIYGMIVIYQLYYHDENIELKIKF